MKKVLSFERISDVEKQLSYNISLNYMQIIVFKTKT